MLIEAELSKHIASSKEKKNSLHVQFNKPAKNHREQNTMNKKEN